MKIKIYKTFKEIDDPHLRFSIKGLAKLYHEGDVEAALQEFNEIRVLMDSIQTKPGDPPMYVTFQFPKHQ